MERQCYVNKQGLPGGQANWLQPSIIRAPAGWGTTRHRAPGSKPVCFPFVSPVFGAPAVTALWVLSCWPPLERMGRGRDSAAPPRHPFRTSKALPALSVQRAVALKRDQAAGVGQAGLALRSLGPVDSSLCSPAPPGYSSAPGPLSPRLSLPWHPFWPGRPFRCPLPSSLAIAQHLSLGIRTPGMLRAGSLPLHAI